MSTKFRKAISWIAMSLCLFGCAFTFIACGNPDGGGGDDGPDPDGAHTHVWTDATCETPKTCSDCGATEGNPLGHDFKIKTSVEATCIDDGYVDEACSRCLKTKHEVVLHSGHSYTSKVEEGSCEIDEVTLYTCKNCDDQYSDITKLHTGHNYSGSAWEYVGEESDAILPCNIVVTEKTKCKTCDNDVFRTYVKHIPDYTATIEKHATCSKKGKISYVCSCGEDKYSYEADIAINVDAHDWQGGETQVCLHNSTHTRKLVSKQNNEPITAEELAGSNVAIKTKDSVFEPDTALVAKMDGAKLGVEAVSADNIAISDDIADKVTGPVYDFSMTKNDEPVNFDGGKMKVTVDYQGDADEEVENIDPNTVAVWYINDEGEKEDVDAGFSNGKVTFTAEHFSYYTVVRLSPAELCAKLGHNNKNFEYGATCTDDGYTLTMCLRCGLAERKAGGDRLGHNYEPTVVQPTCTERGYTKNTCSRCEHEYMTLYTPVKAHEYENTTVEPTCTAKGYNVSVCKNCKATVKNNYTEMVAHNYVNGACYKCGLKQGKEDVANFYMNFIDTTAPVNGAYIEVKDLDITIVVDGETITIKVPSAKIDFSLDENGYLAGGAVLKFSEVMSSSSGRRDENGGDMTLVFKDGKIYMNIKSVTSLLGYTETEDSYRVIDQTAAMDTEAVKKYLELMPKDDISKIFEALWNVDKENNPLEKYFAKFFEFIFEKKESDEGYTLTFDYNALNEVVKSLKTDNVKTVLDKVLGEGGYDRLYAYLYTLPESTVEKLELDLFTQLNKLGLSKEDIYATVNAVIKAMMSAATPAAESGSLPAIPGMNGAFDVDKLLGEYRKLTVAQLVSMYLPEDYAMTAEKITEIWKGYCEEYNEVFTGDLPVTEAVYGLVMQESSDNEREFFESIIDYVDSTVKLCTAALDSSCDIVFTTDKLGKFISAKAVINGLDIMTGPFMNDEDYSVKVKANGEVNVTTDTGMLSVNTSMVSMLDNEMKNLNVTERKIMTSAKDPYIIDSMKILGENYTVMYPAYYTLYSFRYDGHEPKADKYNGKDCVSVTASASNYGSGSAYIVNTSPEEFALYTSCTGWKGYQLGLIYINDIKGLDCSYKVYLDNSMRKLLGYELVIDADEDLDPKEIMGRYGYTRRAYYNASKKAWSLDVPHNYVFIDEKIPQKCEEYGYRRYRCRNCGQIHLDTLYVDHKAEWVYTLVDSTKGCEGGVIESYVCGVCDKTIWSYNIDGVDSNGVHIKHRRIEKVDTAECGDVYIDIYVCACGKYLSSIYINNEYTECRFNVLRDESEYCSIGENGLCKHGHREHRIEIYRCYMTDCGYKYTKEMIYDYTVANCIKSYTRTYNYTFENGKKYTAKETGTDSAHVHTEVTTESGNTITILDKCSVCGKTLYEYRYLKIKGLNGNDVLRQIYEYDHVGEHGWRREFDGCDYISYYIDGDKESKGGKGTNHEYITTSNTYSTCTQFGIITEKCNVCGDTRTAHELPRGHYFRPHFDEVSGKEIYICEMCGLEVNNGVDGPVIYEPMYGKTFEDGKLTIGYNIFAGRDIELYVTAESESGESQHIEDEVLGLTKNPEFLYEISEWWWEWYENNWYSKEYGTITLDLDKIAEYLEANQDTTSITVNIAARLSDDGFDDDRFDNPWNEDFYNFAITYNVEELSQIIGEYMSGKTEK